MTEGNERALLTHSSKRQFQKCQYSYYLRHVLMLSRAEEAQALRMGSAVHAGAEVFARGGSSEEAVAAATEVYGQAPSWAGPEWSYEGVAVACLVTGYGWYYGEQPLTYQAVEQTLTAPIRNPDTGRPSQTFQLGGKVDGIVTGIEGQPCLLERKTSSEDVSEGSKYRMRLRLDPQVSTYLLLARANGIELTTAYYDVIVKPGMRPLKATPEESRKYTKDGRLYANQREADETPEEWSERLFSDVLERPARYYCRFEVPRLEDDLRDAAQDLWQVAQALGDAYRRERWPRTVDRHCDYCEFASLCLNSVRVEKDGEPPAGFIRRESQHPELEEKAE